MNNFTQFWSISSRDACMIRHVNKPRAPTKNWKNQVKKERIGTRGSFSPSTLKPRRRKVAEAPSDHKARKRALKKRPAVGILPGVGWGGGAATEKWGESPRQACWPPFGLSRAVRHHPTPSEALATPFSLLLLDFGAALVDRGPPQRELPLSTLSSNRKLSGGWFPPYLCTSCVDRSVEVQLEDIMIELGQGDFTVEFVTVAEVFEPQHWRMWYQREGFFVFSRWLHMEPGNMFTA